MELLTSGNSGVAEPHSLKRNGSYKAELTGGNLSLLCSIQGKPWQLDTRNKILVIENLSEYHYYLDRMMQNLRMVG